MKPDKFGDNEPVGGWLIREAVGFLMWLANQTRPDIADAERAVTRYANKPREVHWRTAIGIVHNLFLDFRNALQKGSGLGLEAFADANYASKATDRRSVSGDVVMCAGACVF